MLGDAEVSAPSYRTVTRRLPVFADPGSGAGCPRRAPRALSGVSALYRERKEAEAQEACDGDPSASVITETGRPGSCHGYMEWAS
jgi:hypothetical protein